jgi:hypothetical protein
MPSGKGYYRVKLHNGSRYEVMVDRNNCPNELSLIECFKDSKLFLQLDLLRNKPIGGVLEGLALCREELRQIGFEYIRSLGSGFDAVLSGQGKAFVKPSY